MSNARENSFLQSILAAPEDDDLRLIFTDWLEEQDDADRAEFIRLQIRQDRLDPFCPLWEEIRERIEALLAQHRSRWVANLPEWASPLVEFRRGFPAHIRLGLDAFLESADELARVMPLESAEITLQRPQDLDRLARHPSLGLLRKLKVAPYGKLNAGSIRELAFSPYLSRLAHLDLACQKIGSEGVAHLARAILPALRILDLFAAELGPEGLEALHSASFLGQLTELQLGANSLGPGHLGFLTFTPALEVLELDSVGLADGDMEVMAKAHLTHLRNLALSENAISHQGLAVLASSPCLASLTKLGLYKNPLGEGAGEALANASFRLTSLELDDVELGDAGLARFVLSDRVEHLSTLTLAKNSLTVAGTRILAESPHLRQLRHLDLSQNPLGSDGALTLLTAPSLPSLRHLDLDRTNIAALPSIPLPLSRSGLSLRCLRVARNRISGPLAQCLFSRPELAQLESLFVFDNPLGAEGMEAIARSPALTNLDCLHASHTALGTKGAQALAASTSLHRLRSLVLIDCGLGDEGLEALAGSPILASVEKLDLNQNGIQVRGALALAASPNLRRLQQLSLYDNPLGDAGAVALTRAVWVEEITHLSLGYCRLGSVAARAMASVPFPGLGRLRYLGLIGNTPELQAALSDLHARFGSSVSFS